MNQSINTDSKNIKEPQLSLFMSDTEKCNIPHAP